MPQNLDRSITACFTGHRATKLPWQYDENDERCILLKCRIDDSIKSAYSDGYRNFICGMAHGADTYAAEAVLKQRLFSKGISLICVFPYRHSSSRSDSIARHADSVIYLNDSYVPGCMQQRNRFMIEHSSFLIAIHDGGSSGGTAQTIRMATDAGIRISYIGV